jgi:hypothetical protein
MGLDACVYCDCFEKGRLCQPPPTGCRLAVAEDGSLFCGSDHVEVQLAFDQWQLRRACPHEAGVLLRRRLGNTALVGELRAELQQHAERFPLLLSKVLYSGTHCGDFISLAEVERLRPELEVLAGLPCAVPERAGFAREFAAQMRDLVSCALAVGKPIAF